MSSKINADHLARGAVVYVRQSTMSQVIGNTESKRRQYGLADQARAIGFASVTVIDEDLGRSGSGSAERPGFQRLVTAVCAGEVGAVFCIEASRLARNGRDWHHLVDLCALAATLVIDPDGVYDPRLVNDRLLLGLKGTMSEYELSLLRQRGIEARDGKARRGALRFTLPPGYCWSEDSRIEIDPDERVSGAVRMVFAKYRELGSARQLFLWARNAGITLPVVQRNLAVCKITWRAPAYHTVVQILHNPIYAGAYVFARRGNRIRVENGRARKTTGHDRPIADWGVLIRDNHESYISWAEFEENLRMFGENAHMQKRASRKAARGGRALLTGLVRCGRCGRMMRVFYGAQSGHAHRYQCRGDDAHVGVGLCVGIGGVRVDQAVTTLMLEAVSGHAIEAALMAAEKASATNDALTQALQRDLETACYEALLAARRYEFVDPARRHVARELEARWNTALEKVSALERRIAAIRASTASRPQVDRDALLRLAEDLPSAWNAPTADNRLRQRLTHALIREVVIDLDNPTHEAVVIVHWMGGQHTETRIARVRSKPRRAEPARSPTEVIRRLAQEWPDRQIAVTLNSMRSKTTAGETWTSISVREIRDRLGVAAFTPNHVSSPTVSVQEVARRSGICTPSVLKLIREGALPARQAMRYAPWKVPAEALTSESFAAGLRRVKERRPKNLEGYQRDETMQLPGL